MAPLTAAASSFTSDRTTIVTTVIGTLPVASVPTMRQSTVRFQAVDGGAAAFRRRRIEQIGADRRGGMDAEQKDQERRHQRSAADAGHADKRADGKAGYDVERVDRNHGASLVVRRDARTD